MKFVVDTSLKGLAKWLRLCGFDATVKDFPAGRASLPPPAPETFLLTRRAGFRPSQRPDLLVLNANAPEGQLAEIFGRLQLTRRDLTPLKRCGECNDLLVQVPRETVLGLVPDHVFHTQAKFYKCPRCQRLYWPGSHPARILTRLEEALKGTAGLRSPRPSTRKGASHGV